ncbi:MAG: NAD(+) synthase, partial [Candidatus Limnocylindria bacterium]
MSQSSGLPPLPAIEPAQTVDVIVGFVRAQMDQTGFERIVLGLSGGVDSATVAFLCARAVGPDNLLVVRMPFRTSSEASETDAMRVVDALGCRTERVDITPMVEPMLALLDVPDQPAAGDALNVRRGN